jgi:hypothetical protein
MESHFDRFFSLNSLSVIGTSRSVQFEKQSLGSSSLYTEFPERKFLGTAVVLLALTYNRVPLTFGGSLVFPSHKLLLESYYRIHQPVPFCMLEWLDS